MFKIGNVLIKNNVIVAPMAGITNLAFRSLVLQLGAGLVYSEMVSDKAINYRNKKTMDMLVIGEDEHPFSMQLFGNEIASMVEAAQYLDQYNDCDIIDINMGCPVPKITSNNSGSALMKDPDHIYQLIKAITTQIQKPLTVKIRSGYKSDNINAVEVALLCEAAGASAIAVHPRTRNQMYSGHADWSIIKQVKDVVKIPVIGNGDIKTKDDAYRMIAETGCDAIMIGRGLLGNPWLVKEIVDNQDVAITTEMKLDMIVKHTERLINLKGEKIALSEMRGQAGWYLNGLPHNNKVKVELSKVDSLVDIYRIINDYKEVLKNN